METEVYDFFFLYENLSNPRRTLTDDQRSISTKWVLIGLVWQTDSQLSGVNASEKLTYPLLHEYSVSVLFLFECDWRIMYVYSSACFFFFFLQHFGSVPKQQHSISNKYTRFTFYLFL